jgi:hypothetical protein
LPDVIFSFQKSQFGYILEGLGMESLSPFGILYSPLIYFIVMWYIVCGHLVYLEPTLPSLVTTLAFVKIYNATNSIARF